MGNISNKPITSPKGQNSQERSCLNSPAMIILKRALKIPTNKLKSMNRRMFAKKTDKLEVDRILQPEDDILGPSKMKFIEVD